jgi:fucose 4-O-acetylase-like acetyltransferase
MGNRDAAVDLVRVVGVAAIVAGHVWDSELTWLAFYPWHVPVFFFLTGYLWKNPRQFGVELVSRAKSLLKPYAFWFAAIFAVFAASLLLSSKVTPFALLAPVYGGVLAGRPFTTFWFVFALFTAALLYRLSQSLPLWARLLLLAVALIASIFLGEPLARTPMAVGSALPALLFIAAGNAARHLQPGTRVQLLFGCGMVAVGAGLVFAGISAPMNIKQGDWGTPVLSVIVGCLISWGIVLLAQALMRRVHVSAHLLISTLALTGFTIVLVHPTVLWFLQANPDDGNVAIFALAFLVPCAIGYVFQRTSLSQWATGVPLRKAHRVRDGRAS